MMVQAVSRNLFLAIFVLFEQDIVELVSNLKKEYVKKMWIGDKFPIHGLHATLSLHNYDGNSKT